MFENQDIIIIIETRSGVRTKSPEGFILSDRSTAIKSKKPRGGVAVFKNKHIDVEIDIISIDFRDCVIFEIRDTDIVIAAMYIPPRNSEFFDDIYFNNLELLCQHFNNRHLAI